jgi:hypothetical protein
MLISEFKGKELREWKKSTLWSRYAYSSSAAEAANMQ